MTDDEYEKVKCVLCPYCAAKLPDTLYGDSGTWRHAIPGTDHRYACEANKFRVYVDTWIGEESR